MRWTGCLLLGLLAAGGCAATGGGAASGPRPQPVPGTTTTAGADAITGLSATAVVHGMSCPLCAHNVDKQLSQIPGVTGVALDMGSGKVKLALDGSGRATRSAVKKAIDESGFTLVEVTTP